MNNRLKSTFTDFINEVAESLEFFPDKPEETPETTVRALWLTASGIPVSAELSETIELPHLTPESEARFFEMIQMRLSGIPLAHITGRQRFLGIEFMIEEGGYIPRKETEILGKAALEILKKKSAAKEKVKVIDLCSGIGNLSIAVACKISNVDVTGSDIIPEAVSLARQNAVFNKVEDRANFCTGDLFEPLRKPGFDNAADLIICNPPYVSSGKYETLSREIQEFEPRMAFDGGFFGLNIISRLIKESPQFLCKGGWLGFEIGIGQGGALIRRLSKNPLYQNVYPVYDEEGGIRAIFAQLK